MRGSGDAGYTLLRGYPRVVPTPLASRAASSRNFEVTGTLTVAGSADLGATVIDSLTTTGDVMADGDLIAIGDVAASPMSLANGVVVANGDVCPTDWTARRVKWDTEDAANADCKDGVIAIDAGNTASVQMRFCCRGAGL